MLVIPKKKLRMYRVIMLCGIGVFLVGAIMAFGLRSGSIIIAFTGILIALIGAAGVDSLYRCPKCKKKLLVDGDRDTFAGKCSRYCPHCGSEVSIVKE